MGGAKESFQDGLDDEAFSEYVKDYKEIKLRDLCDPDFVKGGTLRYTIDEYDARGKFVRRKYRLGGFLTYIDLPALRFVMLRNPSVKYDPRNPRYRPTWSVQLQPKNAVVTLWYKEKLGSEMDSTMRKILAAIESGEFKLVKAK